ncbi:hypothetical protein ACSDR0_38830 [Streptosporangium sp. G11]|uniref:hypothetical protein n=1 Tax=Streptosporangium sp. G11 TaxID=3436926 RepID=UPI003EB96CC9
MPLCPLAGVVLIAILCGGPPPASTADPAGIVMGTKQPGNVLMIGILNRAAAYERTATPAQIRACTRQPYMHYPRCLPARHTSSPIAPRAGTATALAGERAS